MEPPDVRNRYMLLQSIQTFYSLLFHVLRIGPIEYNLKVGDIDRKVKERTLLYELTW